MENFTNRRVFLLDNSLAFRESLRIMLESHGAEVDTSAHSDEALMKIIHWHPHVLITGVEVGKINGYDLCLLLKLMPDYAGIPVILISCDDAGDTARKAANAGADYYFQKDRHLVSNIQSILAQKIFAAPIDTKPTRKKHVKTVLVIDDSRVMRQVIKNILQSVGIPRIIEASHGLEGLEMLKQNRPDLVLTDWNMPKMNGMEFLVEMRKNKEYDDISAVMVTTESAKRDIEKAAAAGANGHLCKPFNVQSFRDMLTDYATNIAKQ